MEPTTLTERLSDWHRDLAVDSSARLVKNVALVGSESRNGHRYTEAALRDAIPLYDHKPVFLDHSADRTRPRERSTRDLVGTIVAPRYENGRIRGDIRVLDTESGRTFLALAASNAPGVGMSHVVLARRGGEGHFVESIEDVVSVDAVINPATTTTFSESAANFAAPLASSATGPADTPQADDHPPQADHPVAAVVPDDDIPFVGESTGAASIAALQAEVNLLREQLRQLQHQREQEVHVQRMEALLAQSPLPDFALTPDFRRQLEAATDEDARRSLIQERLQLVQQAARLPPQSSSRRSTPDNSTAQFLAAIKRI